MNAGLSMLQGLSSDSVSDQAQVQTWKKENRESAVKNSIKC